MNRRWVVGVVVAQLLLVGVFLIVERHRTPERVEGLSLEPPRWVDQTLPGLTLRLRDGTTSALAVPDTLTLVHVWATWCPPCREELPALLELPARHPVKVVALALDEDWSKVDAFVGEGGSEAVVLADAAEVELALGVQTLPVTFLVGPGGVITHRFDGARDWGNRRAVREWLDGEEDPARRFSGASEK